MASSDEDLRRVADNNHAAAAWQRLDDALTELQAAVDAADRNGDVVVQTPRIRCALDKVQAAVDALGDLNT